MLPLQHTTSCVCVCFIFRGRVQKKSEITTEHKESVVTAVPCTGRWNMGHLWPGPHCQSVRRCSYWEALNIHTCTQTLQSSVTVQRWHTAYDWTQFSTDVHRQDSRSLVQRRRCCSSDSPQGWDTAFGNTSGVALRPASPGMHTGWITTAMPILTSL